MAEKLTEEESSSITRIRRTIDLARDFSGKTSADSKFSTFATLLGRLDGYERAFDDPALGRSYGLFDRDGRRRAEIAAERVRGILSKMPYRALDMLEVHVNEALKSSDEKLREAVPKMIAVGAGADIPSDTAFRVSRVLSYSCELIKILPIAPYNSDGTRDTQLPQRRPDYAVSNGRTLQPAHSFAVAYNRTPQRRSAVAYR